MSPTVPEYSLTEPLQPVGLFKFNLSTLESLESPLCCNLLYTGQELLCTLHFLKGKCKKVRLQFNKDLPEYMWTQISLQFSELSWCCDTCWYSHYLFSIISLFAQRAASHLHSQLSPADARRICLLTVSVQFNSLFIIRWCSVCYSYMNWCCFSNMLSCRKGGIVCKLISP